jgi:hypothetical protein
MSTTKDIRIFQFLDIYGSKFDASLCSAPDINFQQTPQYSIIAPTSTTSPFPEGCRLYQILSFFTPTFPAPGPNHFYIKLDFKRHTREASGLTDLRPTSMIMTKTTKRMLELSDDSEFDECFDDENLKLLVEQGIVNVISEVGKDEKSRFMLVELLLSSDELIRSCQLCQTFGSKDSSWEDATRVGERYKMCGGCKAQKVFYCSKACQKRMNIFGGCHLMIEHWKGNELMFFMGHKAVCGKSEDVVRRIIQDARRKEFLMLGNASMGRQVCQQWRQM